MNINIGDAVRIAQIGISILDSLRRAGIKMITTRDIEELSVNPKRLRQMIEKIRREQEASE